MTLIIMAAVILPLCYINYQSEHETARNQQAAQSTQISSLKAS